MDVLLAFTVFLGSMGLCLALGVSILPALLIGWLVFTAAARRRGVPLRQLMKASVSGVKDSLIVVLILLLIGMLTASWRASGTILFFVYYGMVSPGLRDSTVMGIFLSMLRISPTMASRMASSPALPWP